MGNSADISRCSSVDRADKPAGKKTEAPNKDRQYEKWLRQQEQQRSTGYEKMCESLAAQQLFDACVRGDVKLAMNELVSHATPNCCNADGFTPLMMASAGGHLDVVRLLVTSNAKVNSAPNIWGLSPLGLASAQGCIEISRLLLQWKGDANVGLPTGHAPLARAAASGHVQLCSILLEHGADANACDREGRTAAMFAVERGSLEAVQLLIKVGASMALVDHRASSALSRVVELLLRMDPLGKNSRASTRNPLSDYDYWSEMCNIMVEHQADANIVDLKGDTLLSRAVRQRRQDVIVTLLNAGSDKDLPVPSLNGGTVLSQAVVSGERELCHTLTLRGASLNQPDASGATPLCLAIDCHREEMCFWLLENGAQYDMRDPRDGRELVMKAAANGLRRVYDTLRPRCPVVPVGPGHASTVTTDAEEAHAEYEHVGSDDSED